jgi:RNA polymerase-binding transcription factor DksA
MVRLAAWAALAGTREGGRAVSSPRQPTEAIAVDAQSVRARLEEQRDRLLARVANEASSADFAFTATHGVGETEHVVLGVERGITAALDANVQSGLEDVAAALARLDDGSYGECVSCRLPIAPERLEAIPETRWCVRCQAQRQRR